MEKKSSEGKRVHHSDQLRKWSFVIVRTASLKNLLGKPSGTKSQRREKEYSALNNYSFFDSPPDSDISIVPETFLSRHIPILYTSLLNVEVGNAFVNKSARLSLDLICWISISPFFWSSCV